jgi:1,3-beta-glucanosyltransferase GAS1
MSLQQSFDDYPAPVFLSETGCITVPPRDFADQSAIFGPNMSSTWSGAIIYEWIQELNAYGLISYGPFASDALQQGASVIDG